MNLSPQATVRQRAWFSAETWAGPSILALVLIAEIVYVLASGGSQPAGAAGRSIPKQVGLALFGPYLLGVELASMLLMAGLVGAYHLGHQEAPGRGEAQESCHELAVPMEHGLLLAGILFALGLIGVLVRRNLVLILLSVEIMLNAAGLAFVVAGARWAQADGQVMFIFILAMAAAEVSVGLALVLQLYARFKSLDTDEASQMRG